MDQTAPIEELPLIVEVGGQVRIRCPWCGALEPEESFIELQSPPTYPQQCSVVLKHRCSGPNVNNGGRIFSIRNYIRPAAAKV